MYQYTLPCGMTLYASDRDQIAIAVITYTQTLLS